jgi:hypothetical protein
MFLKLDIKMVAAGNSDSTATTERHSKMQEELDEKTNKVYELTVTLRFGAPTIEAARTLADDAVKREGLAAGHLRVVDFGAEGIGAGVCVFSGPGSSYAVLRDEDIFEPDPRASLDDLWEDEGGAE